MPNAYYCHSCSREVAIRNTDLICAVCGGEFIEELDRPPAMPFQQGGMDLFSELSRVAQQVQQDRDRQRQQAPPPRAPPTQSAQNGAGGLLNSLLGSLGTLAGAGRSPSSNSSSGSQAPPPSAPPPQQQQPPNLGAIFNSLFRPPGANASAPSSTGPSHSGAAPSHSNQSGSIPMHAGQAPNQQPHAQPRQPMDFANLLFGGQGIPAYNQGPQQPRRFHFVSGGAGVQEGLGDMSAAGLAAAQQGAAAAGGGGDQGGAALQAFLNNLLSNIGQDMNIQISINGGQGVPLIHGNPGDYAWGAGGLDRIVTQLLNQVDGQPARVGIAETDLRRIPEIEVNEKHVENGTQCTTCMETFVLGERVCELSCHHIFHRACLEPWLTRSPTCPICRHDIDPSAWPEPSAAAHPGPAGDDLDLD